MPGCSGTSGSLDESRFTTPLPWVGLYVAGASLMCALLMGTDAYNGFRKRKLWFPSNWFSLNAATLTILGIATKLPVDLNTPMPGRWDQLTKLSGTVLICTVMANFMPSLGGKRDSSNIDPDVIALAIFVGTVISNVGIQMSTGVVYVYLMEHFLVLVIVSVIFLLLASTAFIVPTTKAILNGQYNLRYNELEDDLGNADNYTPTKLKEYVHKYWLMAHTCNPQYVIGRSVTCTASGAFSLMAAVILTEAIIRSFVTKSMFCNGDSDYKWSTLVVLVAQYVAVVVGTIGPVIRWFNVVTFNRPELEIRSFMEVLNVEKYWIQRLCEWKENPLANHFQVRWVRRFIHDSKKSILLFSMVMQIGVVVMSKVVRIISLLLGGVLVYVVINLAKSTDQIKLEDTLMDFDRYILHLEGECDLVTMIMRDGRRDTDRWISTGRRNKCRELIEFIKDHSSISQGFRGVCEFDTTGVDTPPKYCWALPVVTLTSIAVALPGIDQNSTKLLLKAVSRGLTYIRLVDGYLDNVGLVNMRSAADVVWLNIDLYRKWYGVSLDGLKRRTEDGHAIVGRLGRTAENLVSTNRIRSKDEIEKGPLFWPEKVVAADCMRRICTTISGNRHGYVSNEELFWWIRKMIADILGSCFTNLSHVIYMDIVSGTIEEREEIARDAAILIGEAEELLEMLRNPEVACFYPENKEHIWDWQNIRCV